MFWIQQIIFRAVNLTIVVVMRQNVKIVTVIHYPVMLVLVLMLELPGLPGDHLIYAVSLKSIIVCYGT